MQDEPDEGAEYTSLLIDLGDAVELTLGSGWSTNENKRQIYS